jgi:CBS domain containing-hemolysin-like protein
MESTIEEVRKTFIESGFSRLPVYRDNLDHITGIVPVNDFFKDPHSLKEITRPVLYVPEARKSIDMLNDFVNQEISFAVVVDEFGGTAGIVTMEDILEELYGEIKDEYDIEEDICRMVNDHTFIINGKIEIDYINEQFKLGLPKGEYETISGLITSFIGRIPAKDEEIVKDHFVFHIIRSSNVKVEMVKLIVRND